MFVSCVTSKKAGISCVYRPEFLSHSAVKSCFMNNTSFMEEAKCISQKYNLMDWSLYFTGTIWMRHISSGCLPCPWQGGWTRYGSLPTHLSRHTVIFQGGEFCSSRLLGTVHTNTRTQGLLCLFHYPSKELRRVNNKKTSYTSPF